MKVLQIHNYYQQPGGEDVVVEQERLLLQSRGDDVELLALHNDSINNTSNRVGTALRTVYSGGSKALVSQRIKAFRPDVVHVHNFFPLFSPSVYYACRAAGVPVVQTLHNFRLICPSALLFRDGAVCELCVGKSVAWPGVVHACYRNSIAGSAALTAMLAVHRILGTWNSEVSAYIALTNVAREKLIAGGLPAERIWIKPNFVLEDPGEGNHSGDFALFVGRLSPEKGISTLISAWSRLRQPVRLKIVGDGPLREEVQRAAAANPNIEFLERKPSQLVQDLMRSATFLVFPSEWYEGFPRVLVEAFSAGLPIVASRLGAMAELVDHRRTGVLFEPADPDALAGSVDSLSNNRSELTRMSQSARTEFESKYSAERNYQILSQIYNHAIGDSQAR